MGAAGRIGNDEGSTGPKERSSALRGNGRRAKTAGGHEVGLPSSSWLSPGILGTLTEHFDPPGQGQLGYRVR
jgi:hypothetical protein